MKINLLAKDGTQLASLDVDPSTIDEASVLVYEGKYFMYQSMDGRFFSNASFKEILPPVNLSAVSKSKTKGTPQPTLYVFTNPSQDPSMNGVMVSSMDPDASDDFDLVEREGFLIPFSLKHKCPLDTEAGIIRNKLANGGARVILR